MTKKEYMKFHQDMCTKMIAITRAKNSDYTGESSDPFANFKHIGALVQLPRVVEIGFLTRMSDKMSRIGAFLSKGSLKVKDESVIDTLCDLANYSILLAGHLSDCRRNELLATNRAMSKSFKARHKKALKKGTIKKNGELKNGKHTTNN